MTLIRISRLYIILGKNFNAWISPILTGILFFLLRLFVGFGRYLDLFLFRGLDKPLNKPIVNDAKSAYSKFSNNGITKTDSNGNTKIYIDVEMDKKTLTFQLKDNRKIDHKMLNLLRNEKNIEII